MLHFRNLYIIFKKIINKSIFIFETSLKAAALITGGAKRIGKSISLALADRGYNIALHYSTSESEAKKVKNRIIAKGVDCTLFQADLNQNSEIEKLIPEVLKQFINLNLLINNASVFERKTFTDTDMDIFNRHFNINFKAPFFITQSFAEHVSSGQIINILDTKISGPSKNYFIYTLSKKCLYDFTKMAARELAPDIRINGISPGLIMASENINPEIIESVREKIPLKNSGGIRQIIAVIDFLIKNKSITGEIIFVDGGEHLR